VQENISAQEQTQPSTLFEKAENLLGGEQQREPSPQTNQGTQETRDSAERAGMKTGEALGEAVHRVGGAISSVVEGISERLGLKKPAAEQQATEDQQEVRAQEEFEAAGKEDFSQAAESGERIQDTSQPSAESEQHTQGGPGDQEDFSQAAESGEKIQDTSQPSAEGKQQTHGTEYTDEGTPGKETFAQAAESGEKIQQEATSSRDRNQFDSSSAGGAQSVSGPAWGVQASSPQEGESQDEQQSVNAGSVPSEKAGQSLTGPEWAVHGGHETQAEAEETEVKHSSTSGPLQGLADAAHITAEVCLSICACVCSCARVLPEVSGGHHMHPLSVFIYKTPSTAV
jgi:hypothetical protein